MLSISVSILDGLIASGALKPTRIGHSVRISVAEVSAFVERQTDRTALAG